jgi:hypothetical protein
VESVISIDFDVSTASAETIQDLVGEVRLESLQQDTRSRGKAISHER